MGSISISIATNSITIAKMNISDIEYQLLRYQGSLPHLLYLI